MNLILLSRICASSLLKIRIAAPIFPENIEIERKIAMLTYILGDPKLYEKVTQDTNHAPGIYRLHYQSSPDCFMPISRLFGEDKQGILYIGASANLPNRIGSLKKSVSAAYGVDGYKDYSCHQCGKKIILSSEFKNKFLFIGLNLTITTCKKELDGTGYRDGDQIQMEWDALSEYFSKFGEYPPLNG